MKTDYIGRFPLLNFAFSKLIFAVIRYRLWYLRCKNKVKKLLRPKDVKLVNDGAVKDSFMHFVVEGYEKFNIGGGAKNLDGFVNIDFLPHPNVEREIKANILDLSFIPDASIVHVHSNHVLEHLDDQQFKDQLVAYNRILKADGLLTIRCPSALGVCFGFWFGMQPELERDKFLELGYPADDDFHNPLDRWYEKDFFGFLHWMYGDVGNIANQHLQIFTPTKLKSAVNDTGFAILKMTNPEASNIIIVARKGTGKTGE